MDTQTNDANLQPTKGKRSAKGRKDNEGQEAVIKTQPLKDNIKELMLLKKKLEDATGNMNAAIKRTAEKSGLLSSVVRRLVNARHSGKFAEEKVKVDQLGIVFEEVGEDQTPGT